jgi:hypothetical protein
VIRKDDGPANPSSLSNSIGVEQQITTRGGGLYLQALQCLSQKSEQIQESESEKRIEYLALLIRRAYIGPQC